MSEIHCTKCSTLLVWVRHPITGAGSYQCPNFEDGTHYVKFNLKKRDPNFMTFQQFDEYQEILLKEVVVMKTTKGKEYANSEDRFANFNRLAPRLGISNLAVCLVYLTKHMDAIESYCKNERTYSTESIQGRIVDAITYLTLLGGMIKQKDDNSNTK